MEGRRTKIVATLGPACSSPDLLKGVIGAGVDVVRLNFAHGSFEDHKAILDHAVDAVRSVGRVIGALVDLPGPKMRSGPIVGGSTELRKGATVLITEEEIE